MAELSSEHEGAGSPWHRALIALVPVGISVLQFLLAVLAVVCTLSLLALVVPMLVGLISWVVS